MKNIKLILFLFFTVCFCSVESQNPTKNYYYVKSVQNLSENHVKAIMQDSKGFMWFGTKNGLNRFDGNEVKIYKCEDNVQGIGNNNISALFEDKKHRIWVGTDQGIYIFDPLSEKFSFFNVTTKTGVVVSDWVAQITEDQSGRIWIIIPNQGVFAFDIAGSVLAHYPFIFSKNQTYKHPQCITILKSGEIWIGTNKDGLYRYNVRTDKFDQYVTDKNGVTIKNDMVLSTCEYGDYILLGMHEGMLKKYNHRTNTFSVVNSPDVHYKIIRDVKVINNELWVGTDQGIYIIDEENQKTEVIRPDIMIRNSLNDNKVCTIYQDNEKNIWIGTIFGGANYIPTQALTINWYVPNQEKGSITGRIIRDLKEDENGNIWICTEDEGIAVFNPQTQIFDKIIQTGGLQYIPKSIIENQQQIWIGLFKNGIDIYNSKTKKLINHLNDKALNIDEPSIWAMHLDRKGDIWIGNGWNVYSTDKNTLHFKHHKEFGYNFIFDIYEDSKGYIWVCTMGNGVYKLDTRTQKTEHYSYQRDDKTTLSSNSVSSVTEDKKGNLWFSTDRGGICKYIEESKSFKSYSVEEGLPDDVAYKIVEDNEGMLWFGTNHGLVRFDPETEKCRIFTEKDGILNNQFNYKSAIKSRSGKLYFGCISGLMTFHPNEMKQHDFIPPLYITKFFIFNEEVNINTEKSPLENSIIYTKEIVLNHTQNSIRFGFSSLSYSLLGNYVCAYKLENFDKEWMISNDGRSVSYTNLNPGKYTFRVVSKSSSGEWADNETSVHIIIKSPWWRSTLATYLYIILTISTIVGFIALYNRLQEKRFRQKQIEADNQHEKDIYNSKIEFFTDIAHEIRTPLTLINGPLEAILEEDNINPTTIRKNMLIMEENVKRLLHLINQLLDFRKIDERKFVLNFSETNLNELLHKTIQRFHPLIEQKEKKLELNISEKQFIVNIDSESIIKIISNLMNNAIKYSEENIKIDLYETDSIVHVCFSNDGEAIPIELSQKVFEPFFRTTKGLKMPGSGIGLSLASNLAKLNNAELILDTTAQETTFILSVPIVKEEESFAVGYETLIESDKKAKIQSAIKEEMQEEPDEMQEHARKEHSILLVEDEIEVLNYLSEQLKKYFNVYTAVNGLEALAILKEQYINIILSDLIMPEMDGLEFCQSVKSNAELAHIPFVLFTAKTDMDSKLQSLEIGADAYIEKPASFNYLYKHLSMLLKNRDKEKKAFLNKPFFPVQKMKVSKSDEKFLEKVIGYIEKDLTNPELNVHNLANALYVSRSGFYLKIKQITTLSPVEFIKLIRLKKAAQLIQEGEYQIAEVCFMVGINSPSYFTKMFHNQFGVTPKEFAKNSKEGKIK